MPLIDGDDLGGWTVGTVGQRLPLFDLNDDEIAEELEECRAREARRLPMGFRHGHAATTDETPWPVVPRFDVVPPSRPLRTVGLQLRIDGDEVPHEEVAA